jgi:hypothetical protein
MTKIPLRASTVLLRRHTEGKSVTRERQEPDAERARRAIFHQSVLRRTHHTDNDSAQFAGPARTAVIRSTDPSMALCTITGCLYVSSPPPASVLYSSSNRRGSWKSSCTVAHWCMRSSASKTCAPVQRGACPSQMAHLNINLGAIECPITRIYSPIVLPHEFVQRLRSVQILL